MSGLALRSLTLRLIVRASPASSEQEALCKCCGPSCHYQEHESYDEWWHSKLILSSTAKTLY
jgi:hypothetical protein